jgi:hypothetical protein
MLTIIISSLFILVYIALQRTAVNRVLLSGLGNLLCYLAVFVFIVSTFTKAMRNDHAKD